MLKSIDSDQKLQVPESIINRLRNRTAGALALDCQKDDVIDAVFTELHMMTGLTRDPSIIYDIGSISLKIVGEHYDDEQ